MSGAKTLRDPTASAWIIETLVGRVGFQAGANFAEGAGTVYLTASLNHDFRGEAEASAVRGDSAVQRLYEDLGGTWVSH